MQSGAGLHAEDVASMNYAQRSAARRAGAVSPQYYHVLKWLYTQCIILTSVFGCVNTTEAQ
jgi:hypothetical protein